MLTKRELASINSYLSRYALGQLARPLSLTEVEEVNRLRDRVAAVHRDLKPVFEKGAKVLEWRVSRELAPRLNEYAFMKNWQRTRARQELDAALMALIHPRRQRGDQLFPLAMLNMAKKKRWVRATRFSTKQVDDTSIDVIGGKMPIDALVRLEVLVDDSPEWCVREALSAPTKRGNTHLLVEVFEVTTEGEDAGAPLNATVQQHEREPGILAQHLREK